MHEMSTCKKLIEQIEKHAQSQPDQVIVNIKLSIGELARVDIDELVELFPIASIGTRAENAKLTIERQPISIKCLSCSKEANVSIANMNCPVCGAENTQLLSGTDMLLTELEFE